MTVLKRLRITPKARHAVSLALFAGLLCSLLVSCEAGLKTEEKMEGFRLPNSGIPVFFAAGMGLNPDFTAVEEVHTAPDVFVERDVHDLVRLADATASGRTFSEPEPEFDAALRECLRMAVETP